MGEAKCWIADGKESFAKIAHSAPSELADSKDMLTNTFAELDSFDNVAHSVISATCFESKPKTVFRVIHNSVVTAIGNYQGSVY